MHIQYMFCYLGFTGCVSPANLEPCEIQLDRRTGKNENVFPFFK